MRKAVCVVGKVVLMLGVLWASVSIGKSYSSGIAAIARGEGQYAIRRAVTPPEHSVRGVVGHSVRYAEEVAEK